MVYKKRTESQAAIPVAVQCVSYSRIFGGALLGYQWRTEMLYNAFGMPHQKLKTPTVLNQSQALQCLFSRK